MSLRAGSPLSVASVCKGGRPGFGSTDGTVSKEGNLMLCQGRRMEKPTFFLSSECQPRDPGGCLEISCKLICESSENPQLRDDRWKHCSVGPCVAIFCLFLLPLMQELLYLLFSSVPHAAPLLLQGQETQESDLI